MSGRWSVPELQSPTSVVRISPDINVPVTARVKRIMDAPVFRRLSRISQLGLVSFVYPGATHTRFEHSLGVYRNAIEFLHRLSSDEALGFVLSDYEVRLFLVAALLHDVGHWPFCHAIEDLKSVRIPRHEVLARRLIVQGEMADILQELWGVEPNDVAVLLDPNSQAETLRSKQLSPHGLVILQSMLSGPVDIDKLDYLERDSRHAGVPYGCNFDRNRLVSSLCIDAHRHRLAVTEKGRTAAEMMVFARYVMFSEVYWHHAVRSATAMLQRAVYEINARSESLEDWTELNESEMIEAIRLRSHKEPWEPLIEGLFGPSRRLYKRVAQFDCLSNPAAHRALARRPYSEVVEISKRLARNLQQQIGHPVLEQELLIDSPPVKLEVQFQLDVRQSDGGFRALGELSPVVHALATKQFDDLVKRVRIFVAPHLRDHCANIDWLPLIHASI